MKKILMFILAFAFFVVLPTRALSAEEIDAPEKSKSFIIYYNYINGNSQQPRIYYFNYGETSLQSPTDRGITLGNNERINDTYYIYAATEMTLSFNANSMKIYLSNSAYNNKISTTATSLILNPGEMIFVEGHDYSIKNDLVINIKEPDKYELSFNTNGASPFESLIVEKGESYNLPTPTKNGYVFEKWYTDSALTIPFNKDVELTEDVTLYAKYARIIDPGSSNNDTQTPGVITPKQELNAVILIVSMLGSLIAGFVIRGSRNEARKR